MALDDSFIDAIFYIPKGNGPTSLADLLQGASPAITFVPVDQLDSSVERFLVIWAGIECIAYAAEESQHYRLYVEFHDSHLNDLLPDTDGPVALEDDPLMPLAAAFRSACELLGAEVGMIITRSYQSTVEALAERYWMVMARFAVGLLQEQYALLFLREDICRDLDLVAVGERHDILPSSHGCLIFAGNKSPYGRWS